MPVDAKLVWVTREERDGIVAVCDLLPPLLVQATRMPSPAALMRAFDAAPEPIERRRCVTHDAEATNEQASSLCWKRWSSGPSYYPGDCRFVTVYEVPAPSRPDPVEEGTDA